MKPREVCKPDDAGSYPKRKGSHLHLLHAAQQRLPVWLRHQEYRMLKNHHTLTKEHFHHVGSSQALCNPVLEAVAISLPPPATVSDSIAGEPTPAREAPLQLSFQFTGATVA
ncbi:MAG: hypothetical protein ICV83_02290 [Cytophagales bacterium]|nr:hypothetical protein [Cytophagales bacterium]